MSRFLSWLIFLPVALLAIVFAVANRNETTLSFWPTDTTVTLPLGAVIVGALLVGVLLGTVLSWPSHIRLSLRTRRMERDMNALRDRLAPVVTPVQESDDTLESIKPLSRKRFLIGRRS